MSSVVTPAIRAAVEQWLASVPDPDRPALVWFALFGERLVPFHASARRVARDLLDDAGYGAETLAACGAYDRRSDAALRLTAVLCGLAPHFLRPRMLPAQSRSLRRVEPLAG